MKNAVGSACALFFLGASFAFAQTTTTTTQQNTPQAQTPASTTVTSVHANGESTTSTASTTVSTPGDPATEATIQKMEEELTQADKAHDTAPFAKYIDDNFVGYGPGWKATGKADVLQGIKSDACTVTSAAMSDFAYKWISPDAVLVTYVMKMNGTCQGKPMPAMEYTTSLWQRKGGSWTSVFHQGTAASEPAGPASPS
jgi:hypothetical protein